MPSLMADAQPTPMSSAKPAGATGVLVLANGDVIWGRGFGAEGQAVGEVCFHTAMTGYQEVLTDPSFAGQMICFTFPHIGNVGANPDDIEADDPHALGIIVREDVTEPSSFRAVEGLDGWMKRHARIGLSGIDTRALTRRIRVAGAPNGVIAHAANGEFDVAALLAMAQGWPGLEGMDLAKQVSTEMHYGWGEDAPGGTWRLGFGYGASQAEGGVSSPLPRCGRGAEGAPPCRGDRLRVEAQHLPQPRRGGRQGVRRARHRHLRRGDGAQSRRHLPVERPRRSRRDRRLCGAGDPPAAGDGQAAVRHLPRPPAARPRGRRDHDQDVPGPPRCQPPGQAALRRRGRDHQHEPRLRGRARQPAGQRPRDSCVAVRRVECGAGADRQAGLLGAVSSRGQPGAAG
ncbi:hypothetical protein SPHINGO391_460038 [Sphingomonas aurantiaca]|uniref:Carbamoyl-phosphate synthase small subunit N-terminal domain-containing protein n=1 Tax=Sphingomonas aurantiaca TaxID=185949 RepID=A0A5E7ZHZ0_9SPHN|nr:hypothetical protein SPHINGO391_460038 [Sphingomonas aurantiaca]